MDQFIPEGYSFLKNLTNGFFGPSILLKNDKTNDQYILKCFSKNAIGDQQDVENFIRIIKTTRRIKEKCFLPFYHYYDVDKSIYCLRPFFEGLNLTSYIANLDVNPNLILAQWKVIVRLYRHLHKYKIAPNFIKPNNIFLESGRIAFITDIYPPPRRFNPTMHRTNPYDVGFLAPEFLSGEGFTLNSTTPGVVPNSEPDIWALGVLLWFMAMKTLPWNLNNVVVMLKQIQKGTPDSAKEFPTEINEYITATMQLDPSKRPTTEVLIHKKPSQVTGSGSKNFEQFSEAIRSGGNCIQPIPHEYAATTPVPLCPGTKETRSSLRNAAEMVVKGPKITNAMYQNTNEKHAMLTFPVRRRQPNEESHSASTKQSNSTNSSALQLTLGQNRLKRRTISSNRTAGFPKPP